jgi:hypothetical protein
MHLTEYATTSILFAQPSYLSEDNAFLAFKDLGWLMELVFKFNVKIDIFLMFMEIANK